MAAVTTMAAMCFATMTRSSAMREAIIIQKARWHDGPDRRRTGWRRARQRHRAGRQQDAGHHFGSRWRRARGSCDRKEKCPLRVRGFVPGEVLSTNGTTSAQKNGTGVALLCFTPEFHAREMNKYTNFPI